MTHAGAGCKVVKATNQATSMVTAIDESGAHLLFPSLLVLPVHFSVFFVSVLSHPVSPCLILSCLRNHVLCIIFASHLLPLYHDDLF